MEVLGSSPSEGTNRRELNMNNRGHERQTFSWVHDPKNIGNMFFTFDGKKIFNLFRDYPHELTENEKELFDTENPYWAEFFRG